MFDKETKDYLVCAIDLGGTHLRAGVIDAGGQVHFRLKQETRAANNPQEIVAALLAAARECDKSCEDERRSISSISVVIPGTVNVAAGTVVTVPNIPSLNSFELRDALTEALGRPVVLENDANAAAVGEMWMGAGRGYRTLVCVTLGTGVGGGIILDGNLWQGANDSAGEIGHMWIDPFSDVVCGCGRTGCLEVYASAKAIVRMARERLQQDRSSVLNSTDLSAESVFAAGMHGDALALEVFHRMGDYLGIGLANLINILNPEIIVIGGGVANGWQLFEEHMRRRIDEHAFPSAGAESKVVPAECGDDAGLLGAARLAFLGHERDSQ